MIIVLFCILSDIKSQFDHNCVLFCNQEELFSVQEDLTVTVHSKVSHTVQTQADPDSEVKYEYKLMLFVFPPVI